MFAKNQKLYSKQYNISYKLHTVLLIHEIIQVIIKVVQFNCIISCGYEY